MVQIRRSRLSVVMALLAHGPVVFLGLLAIKYLDEGPQGSGTKAGREALIDIAAQFRRTEPTRKPRAANPDEGPMEDSQ